MGFGVGVIASGAANAVWGDDSLVPRLIGSIGLWVGFVGAAFYAARSDGRTVQDEVGLRIRPGVDLLLGGPLGVGLQLVVLPVLYWLIEQVTGELDIGEPARDLVGRAGGVGWIALFAVVGIGAPIAEEIFFRGVVLRAISSRYGAAIGVVGSAAIFGASHLQLVQFPGLFVSGVAFALLAVRTKRLGPAIVCHAAFNLTTLIHLST